MAAVAFTDVAAVVEEDGVATLEFFVERAGAADEGFLVLDEGKHGDFYRSNPRREAEHGAFLDVALVVGDVFFGVTGAEDGEENAVDADGGLDDVRDEFFLGGFVEHFLRLAGGERVLAEVVIAAGGDAPELLHAERILKHDVGRALRVEGELLLFVRVERKFRRGETDGDEPLAAPFDPLLVALGPIGVLVDEIFHLHLLEFAGAEDEVARGDFVAE